MKTNIKSIKKTKINYKLINLLPKVILIHFFKTTFDNKLILLILIYIY